MTAHVRPCVVLCKRGKIRLARETIIVLAVVSYLCIAGTCGIIKRLISTDAALHKILHVQYYMKVRMLQCKYFIKCIYME